MCIPAVLFMGIVGVVLARFDDMKVHDFPSYARNEPQLLPISIR